MSMVKNSSNIIEKEKQKEKVKPLSLPFWISPDPEEPWLMNFCFGFFWWPSFQLKKKLKQKTEFSPFWFTHFMQYLLTAFHCNRAQLITIGQGARGDQKQMWGS